jgi:hypothetical protein
MNGISLQFLPLLITIIVFCQSAVAADRDLPTPQQEAELSAYLQSIADSGIPNTTIAIRVVDQLGKPIDKIPTRSDMAAWRDDPLGFMKLSKAPFTLSRTFGMTDVNGFDKITAPKKWYDMGLWIHPSDLDSRTIAPYKGMNASGRGLDILTISASDFLEPENDQMHRPKPVLTRQHVLYRTTGPEQLWLNPNVFKRGRIRVQPDGSYPAVGVNLIPRSDDEYERELKTAAEILSAEEELLLRVGVESGPDRIRQGKDAQGNWDQTETNYHVWAELSCNRGGLRLSDEKFPYTAPENGYARKITWRALHGKKLPSRLSCGLWIRRHGTPVRYGFMELRFHFLSGNRGDEKSDKVLAECMLWINPSGSRNLERPGTGQLRNTAPSQRPEQPVPSTVMSWRPIPILMRVPDGNLGLGFPDCRAIQGPAIAPGWLAEPRNAGAMPLDDRHGPEVPPIHTP